MTIKAAPARSGCSVLANNVELKNLKKKLASIVIRHHAVDEGLDRLERAFLRASGGVDFRGVAIVGESGTGKTRLLSHFANMHPRLRTPQGLEVPVLMLPVPAKPTPKGLVETILAELGDPIPEKGTERSKTDRVITLFRAARVKMLLLDEFQHFVDQGTDRVQHHVADWLKTLIDRANVALGISGLLRCLAVMEKNDQLKRRLQAPVHLPKFDWTDPGDRDEFRSVLAALQSQMNPLRVPDLSSQEMSFRNPNREVVDRVNTQNVLSSADGRSGREWIRNSSADGRS